MGSPEGANVSELSLYTVRLVYELVGGIWEGRNSAWGQLFWCELTGYEVILHVAGEVQGVTRYCGTPAGP